MENLIFFLFFDRSFTISRSNSVDCTHKSRPARRKSIGISSNLLIKWRSFTCKSIAGVSSSPWHRTFTNTSRTCSSSSPAPTNCSPTLRDKRNNSNPKISLTGRKRCWMSYTVWHRPFFMKAAECWSGWLAEWTPAGSRPLWPPCRSPWTVWLPAAQHFSPVYRNEVIFIAPLRSYILHCTNGLCTLWKYSSRSVLFFDWISEGNEYIIHFSEHEKNWIRQNIFFRVHRVFVTVEIFVFVERM